MSAIEALVAPTLHLTLEQRRFVAAACQAAEFVGPAILVGEGILLGQQGDNNPGVAWDVARLLPRSELYFKTGMECYQTPSDPSIGLVLVSNFSDERFQKDLDCSPEQLVAFLVPVGSIVPEEVTVELYGAPIVIPDTIAFLRGALSTLS